MQTDVLVVCITCVFEFNNRPKSGIKIDLTITSPYFSVCRFNYPSGPRAQERDETNRSLDFFSKFNCLHAVVQGYGGENAYIVLLSKMCTTVALTFF
jgi:hypothetical protein